MGIDDDQALLCLTKDLVQRHHRHDTGQDNVFENVSSPDRGKLIHVPHQYEGGPGRNGLHEVVHQDCIDHRGLVHDKEVTVERSFLVFLKSSLLNTVLQQPVNRFGLMTGGLTHPFGGPPGRGGQHDVDLEY